MPLVYAVSLPSGCVTKACFDEIISDFRAEAAKHPDADGIYLYLHGADGKTLLRLAQNYIRAASGGVSRLAMWSWRIRSPGFGIMRGMEKIATDTYSFEDVRQGGFVYVDKTAILKRLADGSIGKQFFIARPRRFGKSLAVSTLQCLFEGRRDLFRGLAVATAFSESLSADRQIEVAAG